MIATQIANRGVRNRRVLAALARTPREWFVPPTLAADAYEDAPLPIGNGQTISQPFVVALMTAVLAPRRRDAVLEIGTGSGYQTSSSKPKRGSGVWGSPTSRPVWATAPAAGRSAPRSRASSSPPPRPGSPHPCSSSSPSAAASSFRSVTWRPKSWSL